MWAHVGDPDVDRLVDINVGRGLAGEVPFDVDVYHADQRGTAPELPPGSAAAGAVHSLTAALNIEEARS